MRFSYMQDNGVAAIVVAVAKSDIEKMLGPLTDEEYRAHVIEKSIPVGVAFIELPDDWTAPDREFRNAWQVSGKGIGIEMSAAKEVWREKMRRARAPKLQALDLEFQIATEKGTNTRDIANRKQALRDVTADPRIDAAKTPEELKAVWPAELG